MPTTRCTKEEDKISLLLKMHTKRHLIMNFLCFPHTLYVVCFSHAPFSMRISLINSHEFFFAVFIEIHSSLVRRIGNFFIYSVLACLCGFLLENILFLSRGGLKKRVRMCIERGDVS